MRLHTYSRVVIYGRVIQPVIRATQGKKYIYAMEINTETNIIGVITKGG